MALFEATVQYRVDDADGGWTCLFLGLLRQRSKAAVLDRLRELHPFAAVIEVVEVRWQDAPAANDIGFAPWLARTNEAAFRAMDPAR